MTKEEFQSTIDALREKLDETSSALISEDLIALLGAFTTSLTTINDLTAERDKLKNDYDEILKVNARLFQQTGYKTEEVEEPKEESENDDDVLSIDEIVNEKGELI